MNPRRRRNQRAEVVCPHCNHVQWESAIAVSTFCRGCGTHFSISKGKSVPKRPRKGNDSHLRFASDYLWNGDIALAAEEHTPAKDGWFKTAALALRRNSSSSSDAASRPQTRPGTSRTRTVACFDCGFEQDVSAVASSTICPSCSAYISMRDVHVRNDSRQKIRTRGDVTIHKKASLHGSSLACRNLKVVGKICGSVECAGNASFFSHCRLLGALSCNTLTINRRSKVDFLQPVNAKDLLVRGEVSGDFYCAGKVTVVKPGILKGKVFARNIEVEPGGRLEAGIRTWSADTPIPSHPDGSSSKVVLSRHDHEETLDPSWMNDGVTSPA